ncbi:MAG: TrmH family RNA methyltransferase [Candidatus Uhrbacteria bacterium]
MIIIAHNIRSLHNLGSIFRSAETFAVDKIYLTGYTAVPPHKDIAKVALGSENRIPWEKQLDIFSLLDQLKKAGFSLIGLETGDEAKSINDFVSQKPIALILGNEVTGIETEVRDKLDQLVEIPMSGRKKSLNVSVAAGIAMFVLGLKE